MTAYWQALDELALTSEIIIDRPRGTAHPRYPDMIYPLDYGYLNGTSSGDGNEIDCWVGSLPERTVTGVLFTVDLLKRDIEGKLLLGCTPEEMQIIQVFSNSEQMSAMLLTRVQRACPKEYQSLCVFASLWFKNESRQTYHDHRLRRRG